ncbi:hypothetical protein ACH4GP_38165 [Streptomyces celluloflavus]|uniref:HTH cro/C1-type domain-containing protein n=1 Tax=Streptomyces celluloflavus TaxID=58344 RepID=A0ABW7RPW1_9ACTN
MQILRQCRGVSRTILTGLIGMSASWVRRVKNGQLQAPSLEMILRAAESLHVQNLDELTSHKMRIDLFSGPGHPQLPTVTDAVNRFPINSSEQARSAAHLQAHPSRNWAARHSRAESPGRHRRITAGLDPGFPTGAAASGVGNPTPHATGRPPRRTA